MSTLSCRASPYPAFFIKVPRRLATEWRSGASGTAVAIQGSDHTKLRVVVGPTDYETAKVESVPASDLYCMRYLRPPLASHGGLEEEEFETQDVELVGPLESVVTVKPLVQRESFTKVETVTENRATQPLAPTRLGMQNKRPQTSTIFKFYQEEKSRGLELCAGKAQSTNTKRASSSSHPQLQPDEVKESVFRILSENEDGLSIRDIQTQTKAPVQIIKTVIDEFAELGRGNQRYKWFLRSEFLVGPPRSQETKRVPEPDTQVPKKKARKVR